MRLFIFACILLVSAPFAKADAVQFTSGTVTFSQLLVHTTINATGPNGSAFIQGSSVGGFFPCRPCTPGTIINVNALSGAIGPTDMGPGHLSIDGNEYNVVTSFNPPTLPNVSGSGIIGISGGTIQIPFSDEQFITVTAPFDSLYGSFGFSRIFGIEFVGSGTVSLLLQRQIGGPPLWSAQSVTYTFGPPVPEPTSIMLLGTGLIGVLLSTRLKRRR